MRLKRRILSVVLAVCLVAGMLPVMAKAADAEHPHSSHTCDGSCAHVDGDPHKALSESNWSEWSTASALPNEGGNYYLTNDVTISATWEVPGEVTLCLNGYTIDLNGKDIYEIEADILTITDCGNNGTITGGGGCDRVYGVNRGGAFFLANSTLNLYGGTISGNGVGDSSVFQGSGVYMAESSVFNMHGGTITGNTASYGGGVYVGDGTFNMFGGIITNNTASWGGGVNSSKDGTFNISGASKISGNIANMVGKDVHLGSSNVINLIDALTYPSENAISVYSHGSIITNRWSTYMHNASPEEYFISGKTSFNITYIYEEGEFADTFNKGELVFTGTYTVTLNTNDGTINSGNVAKYTYGTAAILPTDVTKSGYTFGGWYDNESCTGTAVTEISATDFGNKVYYAKWTATSGTEPVLSYAISANPATVDFGSITVGAATPAAITVTITNTGDYPVTVATQSAINCYTVSELSKTELAVDETATFTVQPKGGLSVGIYNETITIKGTNGDNSTNVISIPVKFTVKSANSSSGGSYGGSYGGTSSGSTSESKDTVTTTTETKEDGTKVETTTETKADGSTKVVVTKTDITGNVKVTITETAVDGTVVKTVIKKSADGTVTETKAKITVVGIENTQNSEVEAELTEELLKQISNNLSGADTTITVIVLKKEGTIAYKVVANTADLKAGEKLYIVAKNNKTGEYTLVDKTVYQTSENGNIDISMSVKKKYVLLNEADMAEVTKKILATVAFKDNEKLVKIKQKMKIGEKAEAEFSEELNMDNVEKVTYVSKDKKVASVNKAGVVKAKTEGKTTVKVFVTLKNGVTKTLKMRVVVK